MRSAAFKSVLAAAALLSSGGAGLAQVSQCLIDVPDSVEVSWLKPCQGGDWYFDTEAGCRLWDWHPEPRDIATWTGACRNGLKDGGGIVQWFEHGVSIDRFEGTYVGGLRQGFGRYDWSPELHFEGHYADDVPNGPGTAMIAGERYAGIWVVGCLRRRYNHVIAIGVPRKSCLSGRAPELADSF